MCISPNVLPNGVSVACRKCWQCRENKINDWVGRCIAEQNTATAAHSITLTYGRDENGSADHPRAALLTYSDVQKYFKRLRRNGYPLRYFVAGEYGSMKGRAHWHAIIFWLGPVPTHDLRKQFDDPHWVHGTSFWDDPGPKAIRYVCKYIQKDIGQDERQGHVSMSKKPPLGSEYFARLAQQYVEAGLSPQAPFYNFAGVKGRDGKTLEFYLKGASLDIFIASYLDAWQQAYPGREYPNSDLVDSYLDRKAILDVDLKVEPLPRRLVYPWRQPPTGQIRFSDSHNAYYADQDDGARLFWSYTEEGSRAWQNVIRIETAATKVPADYRDASARSSRRARTS